MLKLSPVRLLVISLTVFGALAACRMAPFDIDESAPFHRGTVQPMAVRDGARGGGDSHFFWLPPMVTNPSPDGQFDSSLQPVVTICELIGESCGPLLNDGTDDAIFTTTGGHGSRTIRVDAVEEHYVVNWHTDEFDLDTTKIYRITTTLPVGESEHSMDGIVLGQADVRPVASGREPRSVGDEYIAVRVGRTLPIKFRIEIGAAAGVTAVGDGHYHHSIALKGDGAIYAWGFNNFGQLGDGSISS